MLNLKKGLALVLAAATAFTFAPVSTLTARADVSHIDEYKSSDKIDSIQNLSNISIDQGKTYDLTLKEHEDTAAGTPVGAFRITVTRVKGADGVKADEKKYQDVVSVATNYQINSSVTGTAAATNSGIGAYSTSVPSATSNKENTDVYEEEQKSVTDDTDVRSYLVENNKTNWNGTDREDGGALISLVAASSFGGDVTVTIESLASLSSQTALNTQTLKVSVPKTDETMTLRKTSVSLRENGAKNDSETVSVVITHNDSTKYIEVKSDNADVASAALTGTQPAASGKTTTWNGKIKIQAGEAGSALVTINAYKTDRTLVHSATIYVTVTAGNAKLTVDYDADDGMHMTYSDDAAFQTAGMSNTSFQKVTSNDESTVKATDTTPTTKTAVAVTKYGNLVDQNGNTVDETGAVTGGTPAKKFGDITGENTVAYADLDSPAKGSFKLAKSVYADGNKTVQFNATSGVADTSISYALYKVTKTHYAYQQTVGKTDVVKVASSTENGNYAVGSTNQVISIAGNYSDGDTETWSQKDALPYGAIDNHGLLTLKAGDYSGVTLYVVITATPKDSDVATSSFAIPVTLYNQKKASIFVSDETHYSEGWASNDANGSPVENILYMKKGTTNKIALKTDIPSSYLTIESENAKKVAVDPTTFTISALEATDTPVTVTIKSSSAPDFAGRAYGKIRVMVNGKDSQGAPTLVGTSVNKEKPSSDIKATPAVAGNSVVFDSNPAHLYVQDSSYPSGYRALTSNEVGYGDITITSTGHVVYNKNNGTVYVRAYTSGNEKYNPSTYAYIPVNYGQTVVDTELKVDQTPITIDAKETKQITASVATGSSIEFTSADPTIATVDAQGTVTGVKSGTTYVTVTAKAPNGNVGDSAVVAVIVKGNATITDDTVKPGKVTSLKVSNKKGAYVSVKWKSQGKNINYRIWKKVGNGKWVGKNVAGSKATLAVKKGAKVQVKVKAYVKDSTGKTTWGPKATKAKTFKTDKK